MSQPLPAYPIFAGNIETGGVQIVGSASSDAGDPASGWAVEFVIAATRGGAVLANVTGITLTQADPPVWSVELPRTLLHDTLRAGFSGWYSFNRTDSGAELVITHGPFRVSAESSNNP